MPRKHDIEREQIEWVFGLTGGELNDHAWAGFAYNYDGIPEYAGDDYGDRYDATYRTVIGHFLFSLPPQTLISDEGLWRLRGAYRSSGETECPLHPEPVDGEHCPLCDSDRGDPHGYIYIGEGWREVIYRLEHGRDEEE